ncbi:DUF6638 family protein [Pseudahrensia aquimaris]|uniref:DUF6638 family protein n=1 Tax=Pseudahrensia aquimaris TaxID=744461 RepID=A0ABW3FDY2_9HYPH
MKRLEESELIFGRMMRIEEPHLIERYNVALKGFGLKPTKQKSFRIDMTGFSPEVADELDDRDYLDPNQINRRFIILSPEQQSLPVVHTAFSNTGQLMHEFFEHNAKAINALTIKDVVYGEIDDPVLEARDIEDLLSIEQVNFKVYTGTNLADQATELRLLIDRLKKEEQAWADDELLTEMVDLAKVTGDIRTNELVPTETVFLHKAFWSSHFGGVYIFIDPDQTTVIGNPEAPGFRRSRPWQVAYIDARDQETIYRFLVETGRLELPRGSWMERSGWLDLRLETLITVLAYHAEPEGDHKTSDRRWIKNWVTRNSELVEKEGTLPFLMWAERQLENWAQIDLSEIDPRGRFILSRAKPAHPDQWLVNRLISDQVRFDWLSRYIFNKPAFYADYEKWGEGLRAHVVKTVRETYLKDKAGLRQHLYDYRGD